MMKCLIASIVLLSACTPAIDEGALERLQGRWTTDEERYEDRFFEFLPEGQLRLGLGGDSASTHAIQEIHARPPDVDQPLTEYEVVYADADGNESVLSLMHEDSRDIIRFPNQTGMTWKRTTP